MEHLPHFYYCLAKALTESDVLGMPFDKILSTHVSVECVKCNIPISRSEIEEVLLAQDSSELSQPKLRRLKSGNCAREGCESADYKIHLAASIDVDWETITAKANDLLILLNTERKQKCLQRATRQRTQRLKRTLLKSLCIAAFLIAVFAILQIRFRSTHLPSKYQIDPASVNPMRPR